MESGVNIAVIARSGATWQSRKNGFKPGLLRFARNDEFPYNLS